MTKSIKTKNKSNEILEIDLSKDNKISQKVECSGKFPSSRFGHTLVMVSTTKIVMFGGAIGDTKNFTFSNETFILNIMTKIWTKIDINDKSLPCPRAAHASCSFGDNQMLMYGGSTGNGSLAGDELYFFDIKNGDDQAAWTILSVSGNTPGKRYGHTLCCIYPYIILFGGNTITSPNNDVYILFLGNPNYSYQWSKLELSKDAPCPVPRVYHAAGVCFKGNASGMMILFGGRDSSDHALNDTWGLRKHRDGTWDWTKAPTQTNIAPKERYNHSIVFVNTLMIVSGGRDKNIQDIIGTDVYDTETSEWKKFPSIGLFRHSCFIKDNNLFIHGGFENKSPNYPISTLYKIDLIGFFSSSSSIQNKLKTNTNQTQSNKENSNQTQLINVNSNQNQSVQPNQSNQVQVGKYGQVSNNDYQSQLRMNQNNNLTMVKLPYQNQSILNYLLDYSINKLNIMDNQSKKQVYLLSNQAIVIQSGDDIDDYITSMIKVDIDKLSQENKRIGQDVNYNIMKSKRSYNEDVINKFLSQLYHPFDWNDNNINMESLHLNFSSYFTKEEIDILLKDVSKIIYKEKSLIKVKPPVKIIGNLNGNYYDLMRLFETYGNPSDTNLMGDINIYTYIFNGDFCDRGSYSLEVILLLFALKVKYPDNIIILRGHHEDEYVNRKFGLYEECEKRIGDASFFAKINVVFDILPFGVLIDNKFLCLHGGIGSSIKNIEDIENIQRPVSVVQEVKTNEQQVIIDILYSEYSEDIMTIGLNEERDVNKYGFIVKYGKERLEKFLSDNSLSLVIASHSLINEGVRIYNNEKLIIVYSSSNYMDRVGNTGGMLVITKNCNYIFPKLIENYKTEKKYYKKGNFILSPYRNKKS